MKSEFFSIQTIKGFLIGLLALSLITGCQEAKEDEDSESGAEEHRDKDFPGDGPWAADIEELTIGNENYRSAVWTGKYLQMALMSLQPGERIDLELHNDHDQFIRIEKGEARVLMGKDKENMTFDKVVGDDWAILIPAGYWHEIINTGDRELKLYTIYGPPEHKPGTLHKTRAEAEEGHHHDDECGHNH